MEESAKALGLGSVEAYIRALHKEHIQSKNPQVSTKRKSGKLTMFHRTKLGVIWQGNALDYLARKAKPKSVDLIMTSPPFGLVRKKTYDNEDADQYCQWFRPFAQEFKRVLKNSGSLVIDIGGVWKPGLPVRSLYTFDLLIMLCREFGFHLCQEHYWWNPSKLPTPAEWAAIRRVRVKDAVNCVWWLSLTPFPKANNKRVLAPYSASMIDLLENGYTAKMRPSGHDISETFQRDNGGAVPPNLLAIANTESNGQYQDYCRENNLEIHPARFPALLPEYFMRYLTDPGDLVVDPFAGSCVTGMVAEGLGRKWVAIEKNATYLQGALGRFLSNKPSRKKRPKKPVRYEISVPCSLPVKESAVKLIKNGGATRLVIAPPNR